METMVIGLVILLLVFGVTQLCNYLVVKDLTNKIMAKNYGEIVQAEILKKSVEAKPGLDVKLKESDNEPDSVDLLNQLL